MTDDDKPGADRPGGDEGGADRSDDRAAAERSEDDRAAGSPPSGRPGVGEGPTVRLSRSGLEPADSGGAPTVPIARPARPTAASDVGKAEEGEPATAPMGAGGADEPSGVVGAGRGGDDEVTVVAPRAGGVGDESRAAGSATEDEETALLWGESDPAGRPGRGGSDALGGKTVRLGGGDGVDAGVSGIPGAVAAEGGSAGPGGSSDQVTNGSSGLPETGGDSASVRERSPDPDGPLTATGAHTAAETSGAAGAHTAAETNAAGETVGGKSRLSSASALIWVLLALFGFTLVVQLRSNDTDQGLATARQEDLVRILSDLEARDTRLSAEISTLEQSQRQLTSGVAGRQAALAEADKRADELGLLAGTLPGRGPGLKIVIDPKSGVVKASALLNAVQELRGAGGEVMELVGQDGTAVRIVASTYFIDAGGGGIVVDGARLSGPYTLWVIGSPATMQTALQIPGGVVASVESAGGSVTMDQRSLVEVTVVRKAKDLQYARPVS